MKVVVRTDEYTIYQKRNERYGVRKADRQWVNGADKVEVLLKHDLIKAPPPKAPEPEVDAAPEAAAESDDAGAESAAEDEASAAADE